MQRDAICRAALFAAIVWGPALADAETLAELQGRKVDATGSITGVVRSGADVPLAGVTVTVKGAAERVATTGPDVIDWR